MGVSSQGQLNGGFPYVCVMESPGCDHELDGICQVGHFLLCVHRPIRSHTEIGVAADKAHLPVTLAILKLHCRHREEKGKGDTELENSIVRFTPWGICKSLTHLAGLRLTRIHQDVSWNISSPLLSPLIPCFDVFGKTNCLSVPEPKYTGGGEGLNSFPYHSFPKLDGGNVKTAFPLASPGKAWREGLRHIRLTGPIALHTLLLSSWSPALNEFWRVVLLDWDKRKDSRVWTCTHTHAASRVKYRVYGRVGFGTGGRLKSFHFTYE